MALQVDFCGDIATHVLSCLDVPQLSRMEETSKAIDVEVVKECWENLVDKKRDELLLQPWLTLAMPRKELGKEALPPRRTGKDAIKDLLGMKARFDNVPEHWTSCIMPSSTSSLDVLPPAETNGGGYPETANEEEDTDDQREQKLPRLATVALRSGAAVTSDMAFWAGWHVETLEKDSATLEGAWFGLEFYGMQKCHCCSEMFLKNMSICYSPATGECLVKVPEDSAIMKTSKMTTPARESQSFEVYVMVSKSLEMEFIRICQATGEIERTAVVDREAFPCCSCWIDDVFPAVTVESASVTCQMSIKSITRRPRVLLEKMSECNCQFDGEWMWC